MRNRWEKRAGDFNFNFGSFLFWFASSVEIDPFFVILCLFNAANAFEIGTQKSYFFNFLERDDIISKALARSSKLAALALALVILEIFALALALKLTHISGLENRRTCQNHLIISKWKWKWIIIAKEWFNLWNFLKDGKKNPDICYDCASAISEFFALALTSLKKSCSLDRHVTSARSERRSNERRSPKLCI